MNTKRITLAIAILSTIATGLLAVEGTLPPAWAALTAALGAGLYAVVRALQKRAAGDEWKAMLSTTEAWGAALAIVAPIVAAVAGVLPETQAAQVAVVAAAALKLARVLQQSLPGGPLSDIESLPPSQEFHAPSGTRPEALSALLPIVKAEYGRVKAPERAKRATGKCPGPEVWGEAVASDEQAARKQDSGYVCPWLYVALILACVLVGLVVLWWRA